MAVRTRLGDAELGEIARTFGLEMRCAKGVLGGSVNTNHELIDATGGRWFCRLYEEQGLEAAVRECALLEVLAERGVQTPRPRPLAGASGMVASCRGKPVAVFPYISGEHVCQARVRVGHVESVGKALARLHLLGEGFSASERDRLTHPNRFDPEALRARLDSLHALGPSPEIQSHAARIRERLDALGSPTAAELPLVHGDLFRDNVLFGPAGELVALLDFESASRGTASFDVAVTVLAWCFGSALELELVGAFFQGYRSVRSLAEDELAALPQAWELACLRFATTRITDYELRPAGVGTWKDYRRWLARLEAVDELAVPLAQAARGE